MIEGQELEQPKEGVTEYDKKISDLQADFQAQLDALKDDYEKKLSGRDRAYTQAKRELEEKEKMIKEKEEAGLSEIEKLNLTVSQEREARLRFENDLKTERHRNKAISLLDENGLPKDYLEFVRLDSEESIENSIKKLNDIWGKQKDGLAKEYAIGNGTKNVSLQSSNVTKSWKEMTIAERSALYKENPELATQMMDKETPRR
jgi:hypothetical protein